MSQESEQMDISDLGLWFGKTCPEPLVQTEEMTLEQFSKRQSVSLSRLPLFLDMRGGGLIAESFWDESGLSLGEYTTCSFGAAPNVVVVSRLSQILEDSPLRKYSLSEKACQGILNRAKKRGKILPPLLEEALIRQSRSKREQVKTGGVREYSSKKNEQEPYPQSTTKQSYSPKCYGISPYASNAMKSDNPHSGIYEADSARTLDLNGANPNCNQGGMVILEDSHTYSQNAYDEYSENDVSASLKASGGVYGGGASHLLYQETIGSLCLSDVKGVGNQYVEDGKCIIQLPQE